MNKVFLAFPFNPKDGKPVLSFVKSVDRLIRSHGLATVTGETGGGGELTETIQNRIRDSDAVIALFTREKKLAGNAGWKPTDWVVGELTSARARRQRAVALVEDGVNVGGPFSANERIPLDLKAPAEALVRLSETIGVWKAEAGRFLLVRLLPAAAAAIASSGFARCQVRLVPPEGPPGPWQAATVRVKPGGVFLAVPGVKEDVSIDVEISDHTSRWKSGEFPQWVHVEMRSEP